MIKTTPSRLFGALVMLVLLLGAIFPLVCRPTAVMADASGDHNQVIDAKTPSRCVLVLYPSPRLFRGITEEQAKDPALIVQNLLGHFATEVTLTSTGEYQSGDSARYDAVIYLGTFLEKLPKAFIADLAQGDRPVFWLGRNIEQFNGSGEAWATSPANALAATLHYRDRSLTCDKPLRLDPIVKKPAMSVVWAEVDTPQGILPFGVRYGRCWYMATADLQSKAALLLADQLYDFLDIAPLGGQQAAIRIEDVHPLRAPEPLKAMADALWRRNVPFMVTVIPVYVNPKENRRITLAERPELVATLRYMEKHGGTLLVHGYTHQVGDQETGVGFEFWDADREIPVVSLVEPDWAWERLNRSVGEMEKLGLHPRGVTVPHYASGSRTYERIRQNFNLLVGAPQVSDGSRQTQKVPYQLIADQYGFQVIPENIGYVDPTLADPITPMLEAAKEISVVRDCTVGAFYHSFFDATRLITLVDGLQAQGFAFVDASQLDSGPARYLPELDNTARVEIDPLRDEQHLAYGWRSEIEVSLIKKRSVIEIGINGLVVVMIILMAIRTIRCQDEMFGEGRCTRW